MDVDERARIALDAARHLEDSGEIEDAAALLIQFNAWAELTQLVCAHAPRLAAEGRFGTLRMWTDAIPTQDANMSWILYWRGVCRGVADPREGRHTLEQAYTAFTHSGEIIGRFLALAGIFTSFFGELGGDQQLDRWTAELETLLAETDGAIPPEIEAEVIGSASAIAFRRPEHAVVKAFADRSFALIRSLPNVDDRLTVGLFAASYGIWTGDYTRLRALAAELALCVERSPSWRWASFGAWLGAVLWQQAEHDEAFAVLERALRASQEHGFPQWESFIHVHIAYTALSVGDADRAERAIRASFAITDPHNRMQILHLQSMTAGTLLLRGRVKEAAALAVETLARALELGSAFGEATFRVQLGQMLMLDGQHVEAREHLLNVLAFGRHVPSTILQFQALMALAWSHFDTGDDEQQAIGLLRDALFIGSRQNYMNCHPFWIPRVMAHLCELALSAGIEPDYVQRLIRKRGLTPESPDACHWPWLIEIRALGGFMIRRDGELVAWHGKSQQRVLELLKAIVSFGDRAVSVDALQEALWPDADGDAAKGAFDVTLHRLRKLLGHDEAVVLSSGRIGLNPAVCYLDAATFERAADRIDVLADDRRTMGHGTVLERATHDLMRLYPGHLLIGEAEHPWMLPRRARLAGRFARCVRALGERLVHAGLREPAIRLYGHAIEVDPSDEEIYRRLIRLMIEDGSVPDALRVYTQCQTNLAALRGASPSRDTQSLIAPIRRPS